MSTSPKSTETQSRRKRFSCPNGANRRASGAKTATTTANGANRLASACSVAGAKSATPTACVTSAEMALGLRQTSHSAGHWRFLPPFFFCGCWCNFFFNAPLSEADHAQLRRGASSSPPPLSFFVHVAVGANFFQRPLHGRAGAGQKLLRMPGIPRTSFENSNRFLNLWSRFARVRGSCAKQIAVSSREQLIRAHTHNSKRVLFLLEVTCALAPGPWRSTRL